MTEVTTDDPPDGASNESTPDDDAPASQPEEEFGAADSRGMIAAIPHFHGPAAGAAVATAVGSSRATGLISPATVGETLRWFVEPAEYERALAILRAHQFVVLVAPEGTGKRALALRLLRAVCSPSAVLVSVSPATSLSQLSTSVRYEAGRGYVVVDHIGDLAETAQRSYDAERLADRVTEKGAHLVLTTTSEKLGRQLRWHAVTVTPPEPTAMLDTCLGTATVEPDIRDQARRYVTRLRRPREVVRLARRLVDDPGSAEETMRDEPVELVRHWVDGEIGRSDLLAVTALALTGSQPEPVHERLVDGLRKHADPRPGQREQPRRDHPLMTSEHDNGTRPEVHRIRFRDTEMRPAVLAALHQRYGHQLWRPVRAWVHETCVAGPPPELRVELASGLALLARNDFPYVYQAFLDLWANGSANERTTAAMVLWFMSRDTQLSTVALRTAMAWGQNRGVRRAVTSALALGGPLGVRFPGEALQRLCFLALRAKRIGVVARQSVALLFTAAVDDGQASAAGVLTIVDAELTRAVGANGRRGQLGTAGPVAMDMYLAEQLGGREEPGVAVDETYVRGWGYPIAVAARWLAVAVLCAEHPDGGDPVAAKVLLTQPENIEPLGRLWANVLCSAPHTAAARKGLIRLLRALDQSATAAVTALGAAVRTAMPPEHRSPRITELMREANSEAPDRRPSTALVTALLTAIGGHG